MEEKRKIELLAPAQNKQCAKTAIDCGADSIYIGANLYGARQNASNSLEDIKDIINYAHKFNTKVYITLNTILDNRELLEAQKIIEKLHKIKADGIIFQDMGILKLAKEGKLPDIKLIASTQCNNQEIQKIKFFENIGVKRVILARELSIEAIKKICSSTNIEIETFIHGALCVSYSGQCYLSYKIGKRSANRGECAQACRKKYTVITENGKVLAKNKYLLSLKDFMAAEQLKKLIDVGVTSFKIEGRLKDENYIKNTVLFYRKLLDKIISEREDVVKSSSGKVFSNFEPDLKKSFNRGFCEYFLNGRKNDIHNFDAPNSMGEYIGTADKVCKDFFTIKRQDIKSAQNANQSKYMKQKTVKDAALYDNCDNHKTTLKTKEIHPQDGLCYIENGVLKGFLVNSVKDDKIFPNIMPEFPRGAKIYRNKDSAFENKLKKTNIKRKIGVKFKIYNNLIECTDEDKNTIQLAFLGAEAAKNQDMARKTWIECLNKTGESDFYIENVEFSGKVLNQKESANHGRNNPAAAESIPCYDKNSEKTTFNTITDGQVQTDATISFLPQSKINALRREILNKLLELRLQNYTPEKQCKITPADYPAKSGDWRLNVHNKEAENFYNECNCKVSEYSLESGTNTAGKELMRTKHCIRYALDICLKTNSKPKNQKSTVCSKNPEKLFLIDDKGAKYALKFDCNKCEMAICDIKTCKKN